MKRSGPLERRTPLSDRGTHSWKTVEDDGLFRVLECEKCPRRWRGFVDEHPPEGPCNSLSRSSGLERSSGPRPVNRERLERIRTDEDGERHTYGLYFRWACDRRCCACGTYPCVPPHLKTVGAGGRDAETLIDTCHECHDQIETEGLSSWEEEYGIDAQERAAELWSQYQREAA